MVIKKVTRSPIFLKQTKRIDKKFVDRLRKQVLKTIERPDVGKPLKYTRGERSLYIKPFRLVYTIKGEELILLKFDYKVYN
jgi:mRNA-degrading endonuclease RelE of RelBE toxin-antitoxin system